MRAAMSIAVLYPRFHHPAIEESYASWQSQSLLREASAEVELKLYDPDEPAADAAAHVESDFVLVITDPLVLVSAGIGDRLLTHLQSGKAIAALPVSNEAEHARQRRPAPEPYLTLRELQITMAKIRESAAPAERLQWDESDPAAFLCRTEMLDKIEVPLRRALAGGEVVLVPDEYVHRWSSLRGQTRHDLLSRISTDARSILEFGCGEAPLGEALKKRQPCRVVGIELDPKAAAIAEKRIDAVFRGDVREIVDILKEQFDWIIGGDIVEHLDEPWSFLSDLRRVATPGGRLLLSIPNIANASVIADLLHGRFDYVYMGLTCVGHLRFFTRRSVHELLTMAGWSVVEITPQMFEPTPEREALLAALDAAKIPYARDEILPAGYYVVAQNPG